LPYVPRLTITEAQRENLKQPLGELITGTTGHCVQALKDTLAREKPKLLVLVGDTVSRTSITSGIRPDVIIIDNKEMRRETAQFSHTGWHTFKATNPAGTINTETWGIIEEAVDQRSSLILVDGEEDLLSLVAILVSPLGSLVVYGQPGQGIVIVRVTEQKKEEIRNVIREMKREG